MNYIYKYRDKNGQTIRGVFTDWPSLESAKSQCQEYADKIGVPVTLYETCFVETMVQQFDPAKEGESE